MTNQQHAGRGAQGGNMRARAVVVAGIAVAVCAAGVANATPRAAKPNHVPAVCNLLTDPTGDALFDPVGTGLSQFPADPNGDILSADVASDARNVTAVLRLKSLASPDTTYPLAHFYMVSWYVRGHATPVYLGGTLDPNPAAGTVFGPQFVFGYAGSQDAATFTFSYYNIGSSKVKATIDTAKKTLTLSVPISAISSYGKFTPGAKFSGISAQTQALVNGPVFPQNEPLLGGSSGVGFQEDTADGGKDYVAGSPSCVKPGS